MNLRNINSAVYDSSWILQHANIKLASAPLPVNIYILKTNTKIQLYLLDMSLLFLRMIFFLAHNLFTKDHLMTEKNVNWLNVIFNFMHIFFFFPKSGVLFLLNTIYHLSG